MQITSPDFNEGEIIPKRFTCHGEDINPELNIEGIPPGTQSLALIVDDPDAPGKTWVHWVVFNIPITSKIERNSVPGEQGSNDFERENYGGPCPPSGTHRYFFKLYALSTTLHLENATKQSLIEAMKGHIIDQCQLMGRFSHE
ncbi:MAG: YbhB/YbcL family Raf kinase inhibitor-like protein [Chlamydiales bacterium]|nr:YbhB/YbcL family Raf kinase inhibitor-like protein [Chlamydiales bacterium]